MTRKTRDLLLYPYLETEETEEPVGKSQTFHIQLDRKLSAIEKAILNSFQHKYIYHAMDDIFDLLKTNPREQEHLLAIVSSPMLSLQNNFSINFFNMWIENIYIEETSKGNRFMDQNCQISKPTTYLTLQFLYKTSVSLKKLDPLW